MDFFADNGDESNHKSSLGCGNPLTDESYAVWGSDPCLPWWNNPTSPVDTHFGWVPWPIFGITETVRTDNRNSVRTNFVPGLCSVRPHKVRTYTAKPLIAPGSIPVKTR